MCRLLSVFWEQQYFVTCQNGYHGLHFKETRGTNQGGIALSTLFNLIVENVVSNWIALAVEDQLIAQEGLGLVLGRFLGLLYADNSVLGLWDM